MLPFTSPPPSVDFYRGNFCGLRVPGVPAVPGSNADNPECVMACLLDNYAPADQKRYLKQYAEAGYTHLQRSIGHSLFFGHSLNDHIELSKRARGDYGLFADEWFLGVIEIQEREQDASYWKPLMDPTIEAMLRAGVIDTACVGWQLDQFMQNAPGNATISLIAYIADALPPSVPLYTHWVNEALAWWKTGGDVWTDRHGSINITDRFSWWKAMGPYLTGGHHQGNTTMARTDPKLYQDKMKDTLNSFTDGRMGRSRRSGVEQDFKLVVFECTGQDQFNGVCSEDEGDLVGYLLTCTNGDSGGVMSGYGNGGRMPDGSAL